MSPFFDGYLPLPVYAPVSGGPERRTEIVALASGREARNAPWRHGRRRYDVGACFSSPDAKTLLIAFFEARRGRLQAFRFRDPLECKSCAPSQDPAPFDLEIGIADGVLRTFQLVRRYGEGMDVYLRPVTRPVAGTVQIGVNGVALGAAAFGVDLSTGIVTFPAPPPAGHVVTAGFVFDTPVRFDTDRLDLPASDAAAAVPLIEVLS